MGDTVIQAIQAAIITAQPHCPGPIQPLLIQDFLAKVAYPVLVPDYSKPHPHLLEA